jgi:hypothetical protein
MWLKDMFNKDNTRKALQEILPGVREVIECSCARCGCKCYVLPGLLLDLAKEENKLIYARYLAQKPLFCPKCKIYYCQKCAREGLLAMDVSEDARKQILEQLKHPLKDGREEVLMPGFCLQCGGVINYA